MNNELKLINEELSEMENKTSPLLEKQKELKNKRIELLKLECKKNIGRCFKKLFNNKPIEYCMLIDIYNPQVFDFHATSKFNEDKYFAIHFDYPYEGYNSDDADTIIPFYQQEFQYNTIDDRLFENSDYEEITKEEFMEKFKELSNKWINDIQNKY